MFGFPVFLTSKKDEARLKISINKVKNLVLNEKGWFSQNFVEYSQYRLSI